MLFLAYKKISQYINKVPLDLEKALILTHSYLLVRKRAELGDHDNAADLLKRIIDNLSRFSTNATNILISAVIECQKANRKNEALEYAMTLMKPEYR